MVAIGCSKVTFAIVVGVFVNYAAKVRNIFGMCKKVYSFMGLWVYTLLNALSKLGVKRIRGYKRTPAAYGHKLDIKY